MLNGKPFAMFFNASPRKGWNTAKMLESAKAGAEEAGAETELVNLYDFPFAGCKSCFACKLKNAKTNGVCALRDELRPILERARQADVLVLGSPIYFSYPTGVYRAFLERLAFPVYSYHYENGKPLVCRDKVIETANIFTMNCPEEMMKDVGYPTLLEANTQTLAGVFGASETLYACNTYQFADYSRYDMTIFTEEEKRAYRDAHFPTDLANATPSASALSKRRRPTSPESASTRHDDDNIPTPPSPPMASSPTRPNPKSSRTSSSYMRKRLKDKETGLSLKSFKSLKPADR